MRFGESLRLEAAIRSAREEAFDLSIENRSRLAQLITVWASGYLEATCREVLGAYAEKRANPAVSRYVSRSLERFSNPNMHRIVELVGSFDKEGARQLEAFASGRIRESVNGMVAQRNRIAHGRPTDTTIGNVSRQFEDAKKLAEKLRSIFQ